MVTPILTRLATAGADAGEDSILNARESVDGENFITPVKTIVAEVVAVANSLPLPLF